MPSYTVNPKLWGPLAWYLLHTLSYAYSPDSLNYYQAFFFTIFSIFPCPHCQFHYVQHLYKTPPLFKSADTLSRWVIQIHNTVNQFKRKPVLTLEEAYDLYHVSGKLVFNHQHLLDLLIILNESDITVNSIINILQLLAHIIPCHECKIKLTQLMKSPVTLKNIDNEKFETVFNDFTDILRGHIPLNNEHQSQKFGINQETLLSSYESDVDSMMDEPETVSNGSSGAFVRSESPGILRKIKNKIRHIKRFNRLSMRKKYATLVDKLNV